MVAVRCAVHRSHVTSLQEKKRLGELTSVAIMLRNVDPRLLISNAGIGAAGRRRGAGVLLCRLIELKGECLLGAACACGFAHFVRYLKSCCVISIYFTQCLSNANVNWEGLHITCIYFAPCTRFVSPTLVSRV